MTVTRVHHFDVMIDDDVAGIDNTRALLVDRDNRLVPGVHANGESFQVQQNLGDVFLHTFDSGVFVKHALDLHLGDHTSGHR